MSKDVTISIGKDEWYPVYYFSLNEEYSRDDCGVKIPRGEHEWLKTVFAEFDRAQDYLQELHDTEVIVHE